MSVAVSTMPLAPGDVLHRINTPVVMPPMKALGTPVRSPLEMESPSSTSTSHRRLSAGAAFAEASGINLDAIGRVEAKKIMSIEHKFLGFRPPHGSLAAEAQAAAAKHPEVKGVQPPDLEKLKEAAKEDAERILAERGASDPESPTGSPVDRVAMTTVDTVTPDLDLTSLSEVDARKLMSHEHRALGFRPPPGSLAAEAQALLAKPGDNSQTGSKPKTRRGSMEPNTAARMGQKPRRNSNDVNTNRMRRNSNDMNGSWRQRGNSNANGGTQPAAFRMRRSSSDEEKSSPPKVNAKNSAQRRASLNLSAMPAAAKEELLKEVAMKDAERIKATRGINGTTASESSHVDIKELPAGLKSSVEGGSVDRTAAKSPIVSKAPTMMNLPGPVKEAQEESAAIAQPVQPVVDSSTQRVDVQPGIERVNIPDAATISRKIAEVEKMAEAAEAATAAGNMSRTETTDSVQIVGDVFA